MAVFPKWSFCLIIAFTCSPLLSCLREFHSSPVVLGEIDENDGLILSMDGIDLNTLGELDRIL